MVSPDWNYLPADLVISIGQKLCSLVDYLRFTVICKSWRNVLLDLDPMSEKVWLLLAEEVAPGVLYDDCEYDPNENYSDSDDAEEENSSIDIDFDEEDGATNGAENYFSELEAKYNYLNNSIGSSRGLYNLLTGKTYTIDLPEAAGRLILGLRKGWLLTVGRDLQIHLLHPLLRHQISLPDMLMFPVQLDYNEDYPPGEAFDRYIQKAAISSEILDENLYHHHTPSPTVMAIYGEFGILGFTKLGDKVWTDVHVPSRIFNDIIYHNGNFYAVDCRGDVYVCDIDGDKERGPRGRKIASVETNDWDQKYLVESSSGSGLLLLVRNRKIKYLNHALPKWPKYCTTDFSAWTLNLIYSNILEDISCTSTKVNDLGNKAIFVGRNSSVSMLSSQTIKPNCIYFTDDNMEAYYHKGGGHDMGIFNMEHRTIEPHFQGKSIHPISPPVWYF